MFKRDAKIAKNAMKAAAKDAGYLNAYMAVESENVWTATQEPDVSIRFYRGFLYRKTVSPYFFGGYQIHRVVVGSRLADEWLGKVA